jgi:hypothetical protein
VPHKVLFKFNDRRTRDQGNRNQVTTNPNMFLLLPVPGKIQDGISVKYSATDLGIGGEAIAGIASYLSSVGGNALNTGVTEALGQVLTDIRSAASGVTTTGAVNFASEVGRVMLQSNAARFGTNLIGPNSIGANLGFGGNAAAGIAVGTGQIVNPFTTAVFGGVSLREFRFDWTFAPSTAAESVKIEQIIKKLRAKALPTVSGNSLFMHFPSEIEFVYLGMKDDTFSFPTAPCVMTSISVDRTPTGQPVFFAGTGAPAFISLSMALMEVRPLVSTGQNDEVNTNATIARTASNIIRQPVQTAQRAAEASALESYQASNQTGITG